MTCINANVYIDEGIAIGLSAFMHNFQPQLPPIPAILFRFTAAVRVSHVYGHISVNTVLIPFKHSKHHIHSEHRYWGRGESREIGVADGGGEREIDRKGEKECVCGLMYIYS